MKPGKYKLLNCSIARLFKAKKQINNLTIQQSLSGFTLIEVLLSSFFFIALVTILLSSSGALLNTRKTNLETVAAKVASKQIENLRNTTYASLPSSGSFADAELSKLPQGAATRTLTSYQSSTDIKDVLITVSWIEKGVLKQLKMETLIYKNGL